MNSKQKIVNSAKPLFHQYGIEQTSVDTIISSSGVSKSNFYYHFRSKDELALYVLELRMNDFINTVLNPTLDNTTLPPYERLKLFYEKIINYHESNNCENGCPFGNIALELSNKKEKFRVKISCFFSKWKQKIQKCIEDGIYQNQIRSDIDTESVAELLLSHLEGSIMIVKTQKSILPLKKGAETILKIIKNH